MQRHSSGSRFVLDRRLVAHIALLGLVAHTLGCASTMQPPPLPPGAETYVVGPPDQLIIRVLPDPPIVDQVTVRPDGMISVDLIGDVQASGRTAAEIAAEIEERISRFKRNATVNVSLASVQSTTVVIFGQVSSPGVFPLTRETRVAEAIGLQGGTTIFASKGGVRVIRTDGVSTEVLHVDLGAIESGDLSTNLMLAKGDIIVVPPNAFAKVGFALQTLLFPIQQLTGAASSVFFATGGAGGGGF